MIYNNNEQTNDYEKLYFSYLRSLYNILNYSLNPKVDQEYLKVTIP